MANSKRQGRPQSVPVLSLAGEYANCVQTESIHARRRHKARSWGLSLCSEEYAPSRDKHSHTGPEKQASADTLKTHGKVNKREAGSRQVLRPLHSKRDIFPYFSRQQPISAKNLNRNLIQFPFCPHPISAPPLPFLSQLSPSPSTSHLLKA